MILQGKNVIRCARKIVGATDPVAAENGSIRGDYGTDVGRNLCHSSDSVESAEREIKIWFGEDIHIRNYEWPTKFLTERD
jgi:nucleoside-diphosphate kinase